LVHILLFSIFGPHPAILIFGSRSYNITYQSKVDSIIKACYDVEESILNYWNCGLDGLHNSIDTNRDLLIQIILLMQIILLIQVILLIQIMLLIQIDTN
jgi:hypothetical protein